ncbi:NAD(P)/FAD-dependent oxidoreductase [Gulosibacter molinativorax]|uniref:Ferredoxin reductase n=1 Tax=Gulosibacter molinativorax TaxID=256821 RepID=A0ABT7C487_9MICO|nr:NAD(P)/FAD-dependent oxidoreductase [Gulosibacter molinativorax]MDJ1370037.1 ferredoxin reductase [Gulosibacter molinativorax]QUY63772.1 Hypotetical protein [Gulosibacter molinativorax]
MTDGIVVVGASVATTAFLERLRELGNKEPVQIVDFDGDAPYDRPPLSKQYLVDGDTEAIRVDWADLNAQLVRARAVGVDAAARTLAVEDAVTGAATSIPFSQLVLACGATPARLPFEPSNTLVLRSAQDARALRESIAPEGSVLVIGAGAIGVELASSLAARGVTVTVLDRATGPLERLLGGHLQTDIVDWLADAGVTTRFDVGIRRVEQVGDGWEIEIDEGEILRADRVISAVGARPAVAWLENSGLLTDGALLVDASGSVLVDGQPLEVVSAIGDVASRHTGGERPTRTESWAAAREQGTKLAERLCGAEASPTGWDYFWTEVAGRRVQVVGSLDPSGELVLESENPERRSSLYRVDTPTGTTGWLGINAAPKIAKLLMAPTT